MSIFKEQLISLFKIFLSTVLGMVLVLGWADYAQAITPPKTQILAPNTAYKVSPNDSCGHTAQVKFIFTGDEFTDGKFEEIYPIQNHWYLFFRTPDNDGPYLFQDLSNCGLKPEADSLELLSGVKTKEFADSSSEAGSPSGKREAHFVVGKDYYAHIVGTLANEDSGDYQDYLKLGSLTAIGGTEYPALRGAAIGQLIIKPNSIRAPHWHLKYNETGYCYGGLGQVGIIVPGNTIPKGGDEKGFFSKPRIEEFFVEPGEIFHFPEATQHYLRNVGDTDFECALFFAEGEAISDDNLLTITLSNIVANTPLGVLKPILATGDADSAPMYTAERVANAPEQTYSSVTQGPEIVEVVEACSGVAPDITNPGCPAAGDTKKARGKGGKSRFSIYSTLKP